MWLISVQNFWKFAFTYLNVTKSSVLSVTKVSCVVCKICENLPLHISMWQKSSNIFFFLLQIKLLKLMIVLILLEDQIRVAKGEGEVQAGEWEKAKPTFTPSLQNVRYVNNRAVVAQSMLLSAVLSALKQQHLCHMHRHWITMVTSALPFMGRALSCSVVAVVNQICRNLELLAQLYEDDRYQGWGNHFDLAYCIWILSHFYRVRHITLVAITGTTILVPHLLSQVTATHFKMLMSFSDLTTWQFGRKISPSNGCQEETRASVAIVMTEPSWNIPVAVPEGLDNIPCFNPAKWYKMQIYVMFRENSLTFNGSSVSSLPVVLPQCQRTSLLTTCWCCWKV